MVMISAKLILHGLLRGFLLLLLGCVGFAKVVDVAVKFYKIVHVRSPG